MSCSILESGFRMGIYFESWVDSIVDGLDVVSEGKRGYKDEFWVFGLGSWVNYGIIFREEGSVWWVGGEFKNFVL